MVNVHLKIADLGIKIIIADKTNLLRSIWLNNFNKFYSPYIEKKTNVPIIATIKLTPKSGWEITPDNLSQITFRRNKNNFAEFNFEKKQGEFDIFSFFYFFDVYLKTIFSKLISGHQGLLLHASAISVKNEIFVFSAPKQTGKSTIISLCPYKHQVYADDNTIIREKNNKLFVYPSPFLKKHNFNQTQRAKPVPLSKLFFISQGKENKVSLINSPRSKIKHLWMNLKSTPPPHKYFKNTEFHTLKFKPNEEIWRLLLRRRHSGNLIVSH